MLHRFLCATLKAGRSREGLGTRLVVIKAKCKRGSTVNKTFNYLVSLLGTAVRVEPIIYYYTFLKALKGPPRSHRRILCVSVKLLMLHCYCMYPSMYCCMALIISLGIDEAEVFEDCECFAGQTDCQGLDLSMQVKFLASHLA